MYAKLFIRHKKNQNLKLTCGDFFFYSLKKITLKKLLTRVINELLKAEHFKFSDLEKYYSERRRSLNRLKIVNHFIQTHFKLEWMLIKYLPVLPPNLRPIVKLENNTTIITDLNRLYLRIIYTNNLLERLRIFFMDEDSIRLDKRYLQSNVDKLINNERSVEKKKAKVYNGSS